MQCSIKRKSSGLESPKTNNPLILQRHGGTNHWADLTLEFRRRHFLAGLVLTLLANALDQQTADVHARAVNMLRGLISAHDADER